jgi:hypothetical protein
MVGRTELSPWPTTGSLPVGIADIEAAALAPSLLIQI